MYLSIKYQRRAYFGICLKIFHLGICEQLLTKINKANFVQSHCGHRTMGDCTYRLKILDTYSRAAQIAISLIPGSLPAIFICINANPRES